MAWWTGAIGAGIARLTRARRRLLDNEPYWRDATARIQRAQLRALLTRAARTEFGSKHDFARIARLPDAELVSAYRSSVPLAEYAAFRAMLERMRSGGEPDVLWPGIVKAFAQTSGTTAGDKFIPVSPEMFRSNRRAAMDIFANATRFGVSLASLTRGRSLFLGGSSDLSRSEHGIATGDLSGLVTPMLRWPLSAVYSPGREIALMSDWPAKIEAMARLAVEQDVRMVSGMCSWQLVLFQRVLELARERGRRADGLRDIWPRMELLVHGGVRYDPFAPRMRAAWSGSADGSDWPVRLEVYPASEGFIAMQDRRGETGLRLLTDIGIFYEFVPLDQIDRPDAEAFTTDDVRPGERYVVAMSTCAGLWRYIIGDVVQFETTTGPAGTGPARLRIVGRHRQFMNAFGENLIAENFEAAVATAARETGITVGEFTACPVYPGESRRAGLEVVVEVEGAPLPADLVGRFARAVDDGLKRDCVDYTTKRTGDLGMAPPVITPVPMGSAHRWLESRGKLGGQHKCPRCANHRDFAEGILAAAGGPPASPEVRFARHGATSPS